MLSIVPVAALILAGLVIQFAEFFIPSFGAITICALVTLGLGVYLAFDVGVAFGYGVLVVTLVLWGLDVIFSARFLKRSPLVLKQNEGAYHASDAGLGRLVGKEGRTGSVMRPSGRVEVEGQAYDAMCEEGMLERDIGNAKILEV